MAKRDRENPRRIVPMDLHELRALLSESIRELREGEGSVTTVNAMCNAAGKMLQATKLHIEICKMSGRNLDVAGFLPEAKQEEQPTNPLKFGSGA